MIIMSWLRLTLLSCFAIILYGCDNAELSADYDPAPVTAFDADSAWDEFESTFRLFYAYLDRMDFDLEAAMAVTKADALRCESSEEFRQTLAHFGHLLADPHIIVGPLHDKDFNVLPTSSDLRVRFTDGRYRIEDVRAGSEADNAEIRPGFEIIKINDHAVAPQVDAFFEDFEIEPTARQKSHVATLLANGRRTGERDLEFKRAGVVSLGNPRDFARSLSGRLPLSVRRDDDIAVIRLNNSLGNNETIKAFDEAMAQTKEARGLIIDLRDTPSGGNTEVARSIIGHFIKEARAYQTHQIPSLEREFSVPRQFTEYALPRPPYRDPETVVVLGSYWTGSMGEGLVIGLDAAAGVHTISSDMGDLLGGLSNFDLEQSGIRLDMGTEILLHIDGTPREDYEADFPLISADRDESGSDPAMSAALDYLGR